MINNNLQKSQMVFALDIGTRSVVGLLGHYCDNKIVVKETVVAFHQDRVMMDGQIHDIEGVVAIVNRVKRELEERTGLQLKEVAIAAAGRALKTHRLTVERELEELKPIDKYLVNSLELEALQLAQMHLEEQSFENTDYFCVGHTVVNYYLNDGLILNPVGHRGNKLKLDLIATFLPHLVVDGLNTVMAKIGLEVNFMTLEPIAAIEVAVPKNIRLLNVALVDIGAGTSDIAITKDGSVVAYGMTSTAGDEITEAVAKAFLLDFDTAERIKCNLCREEYQEVIDIIGISHKISTEEILSRVNDAIELVAKEIAHNILMQNDKAPSAVFLIGGGSQIPRLPEVLAGYLGMPKERVVVRGVEIIQVLKQENIVLRGPEGITPIGILAKAIENNSKDFVKVLLNGAEVKLFQSKQLKVIDALVMVGFNPRDLIPKRGRTISVSLNKVRKSFSGDYGTPAEIYVNFVKSSLDTAIRNGDNISIRPAEAGKNPEVTLGSAIDLKNYVTFCSRKINLIYNISVNGKLAEPDYILQDGDTVEYNQITTLAQITDYLKLEQESQQYFINGKPASVEEKLKHMDVIEKANIKSVQEIGAAKEVSAGKQMPQAAAIVIEYNGSPLQIEKKGNELLFVDIFNYIDFEVSQVKGRLILMLNGAPANYTDIIKAGDEVIIRWE